MKAARKSAPWVRCSTLIALSLCVAALSRAQTGHKLPVLFHMVPDAARVAPSAVRVVPSAARVVPDAAPGELDGFIAEQLAHANAIYRPLGIELVDVGHRRLATRHANLLTREHRDALASYVRHGVINCMIVAQLMDVDEPGRERRGVHWRPRQARARHFVVVSAISGPYVLAHELGHFFGNQAHSATPGNLMSYEHTDAVPFFDAGQTARVHATLATMLASRELSSTR